MKTRNRNKWEEDFTFQYRLIDYFFKEMYDTCNPYGGLNPDNIRYSDPGEIWFYDYQGNQHYLTADHADLLVICEFNKPIKRNY